MPDLDEESTENPVTKQAATWWVRGHCGDLNAADRYSFVQWCKASPMHVGELLHILRVYVRVDSAKPLFNVNEDELQDRVVPFPASPGVIRRSRRRQLGWRIAAAAAAAVIGLSLLASYFVHTVSTAASEWRSFALSDGTTVSVGPRTRLRYDLGSDERRIVLARGEALFHVAKDAARPFLVEAGGTTVRATGTQFAVDRHSEQVRITLSEGSVVVSRMNQGVSYPDLALQAGEQVLVKPSSSAAIRRVDTEHALAWASLKLVFEGATIRDAVNEFNRRNRVQIEIDPSIGGRKVSGSFHADDPQSFAKTIAVATKGALIQEPLRIRIEPQQQTAP